MRTTKTFTTNQAKVFKEQLLSWAQQFGTIVWLDSNEYEQHYSNYDAVLAVEEFTSIKTDFVNAFDKLKEYKNNTNDWLFGYLTYDLKNDIENLISQNQDELEFPDLYFFQPQKIILLKGNKIEFVYLNMVDDEIDLDFEAISGTDFQYNFPKQKSPKIKLRLSKDDYFTNIEKVLHHIKRGDIYEANYCQEFYAENVSLQPLKVFKKLNAISNPPFASFFRHQYHYMMCASPERYIKKEGQKIISQPIKGTAKRDKNLEKDHQLKENLSKDIKERSENVMIVDLVRNDLSMTAKKGSVKVEELCKVYSFDQVHQMISTVTSQLKDEYDAVDVLKTTFPMGSMTGAPKISAMQIIEDLEVTKRGLYSGSIGYFTPNNDFDFNVIIRSILYNATKKYASYSVGGAITAKSNPIKEYEECLLKAKAMREALMS